MLCGYSLGGRLALHAALRDPARYAGLVMVGAAAGIEAPAARAARAEADEKLAAWMETQPIEEIVAVWERQPLFADQSDVLVEEQRPGRLAQDPRSLALLLRTAGQGALEPVWQRLPRAHAAGARDRRQRSTTATPTRPAASPEACPTAARRSWRARATRPSSSAPRRSPRALGDFLDQHLGQG